MIDGLQPNVVYDAASAHKWSELNETTFLQRVLTHLGPLMGDAFSKHTFFILSSHHSDVRPESITDPSPLKVLIFISDESSVVPSGLKDHYHAIFKGYLPYETPGTNIFPFNIGYVRDVPEYPVRGAADRSMDVFFSGNLGLNRLSLYHSLHPVYRRLPVSVFRFALSHSSRRPTARLVPRDLSRVLPSSSIHFTAGFKDGLSPAEYGRRLADSRIVLCPKGAHSPETFRHLEAMRAGSVVVSEPLPDTHFYRGSPVITVENWKTGIEQVKKLLNDQPALIEAQQATISWWETVCSEEATAMYMRDRLLAL